MKEFDFNQNLKGRVVLVRSSLNVPIQNGVVSNPFRIIQSLETIEELSKRGARTVVIAHIGREMTDSLFPVYEEIKKHTKVNIKFTDDIVGEKARKEVSELKDGEVLLLENLRRNKGEVENSNEFSEKLASYAGVYINDAFSDSHREHASIVGIPKFIPSFVGKAFIKEYEGISLALNPESPSVAIVGGAKFLTKEPLLRTLLEKYDKVFVGGALANDFLSAKGYKVGKSLVSKGVDVSDLLKNSKIILPTDVVVKNIDGNEEKSADDVSDEDSILDVGKKSLDDLESYLKKARFILWNGPLGNFEEGFSKGTEELAKMVSESSAKSVVGGGDTVAAIQNLKLENNFTHISTAGGAMLQFISDGTLPGIEALN